jgi:hypothetical protein
MRPAFDVTERLLEADLPVGESAANQQEGSDRGWPETERAIRPRDPTEVGQKPNMSRNTSNDFADKRGFLR